MYINHAVLKSQIAELNTALVVLGMLSKMRVKEQVKWILHAK